MSKKRLLSGIFLCPKHEIEFELVREPEDQALCDECGTALEETDELDEQDDSDEDEE